MYKTILFIAICVISIGCNTNPSRGYLAQKTPVMREAVGTDVKPNPLEVVAMQKTELDRLKKLEQQLTSKLTDKEKSYKETLQQVKTAQQEADSLKKQNQIMKKELIASQKLANTQEQQIVRITIDKVRLEQELLKLKINLLKDNRQNVVLSQLDEKK